MGTPGGELQTKRAAHFGALRERSCHCCGWIQNAKEEVNHTLFFFEKRKEKKIIVIIIMFLQLTSSGLGSFEAVRELMNAVMLDTGNLWFVISQTVVKRGKSCVHSLAASTWCTSSAH